MLQFRIQDMDLIPTATPVVAFGMFIFALEASRSIELAAGVWAVVNTVMSIITFKYQTIP
jgi:hypothetical protein